MAGAVRCEETKLSGIRQTINPRESSFFSSCLSKISFWILLRHADLYYFGKAVRNWMYCRRGYHTLIRRFVGLKTKDLNIEVHYLGCKNCEYAFFPTPEGKRNYLAMRSNNRKMMNSAVKRMVKEAKKK